MMRKARSKMHLQDLVLNQCEKTAVPTPEKIEGNKKMGLSFHQTGENGKGFAFEESFCSEPPNGWSWRVALWPVSNFESFSVALTTEATLSPSLSVNKELAKNLRNRVGSRRVALGVVPPVTA